MYDEIKALLDGLVGKSFHYEKQNITIEKYKLIAGNFCIVTDVRSFQFYPDEIEEGFINKLSPAKEAGTFTPPSVIEKKAFVELPTENMTIKSALMDALAKVKEDPAFINQAKSICDITAALVSVQKTEIDMVRLQKNI